MKLPGLNELLNMLCDKHHLQSIVVEIEAGYCERIHSLEPVIAVLVRGTAQQRQERYTVHKTGYLNMIDTHHFSAVYPNGTVLVVIGSERTVKELEEPLLRKSESEGAAMVQDVLVLAHSRRGAKDGTESYFGQGKPTNRMLAAPKAAKTPAKKPAHRKPRR